MNAFLELKGEKRILEKEIKTLINNFTDKHGNFDIEVDVQQEFIREFGLDRKKLVNTEVKVTLKH